MTTGRNHQYTVMSEHTSRLVLLVYRTSSWNAQHHVQGTLTLDVILSQCPFIFQLLTRIYQPLCLRWNTCSILNVFLEFDNKCRTEI
jgi:hypothetical protein